MSSDTHLFVGIADAVAVRREALNSSKEVLSILKDTEKYHRLRRDKLDNILKLCRVITEVSSLNKKLKSLFPKFVLEKEGVIALPDVDERVIHKVGKSKIEVLEDELEAIESRLNALS